MASETEPSREHYRPQQPVVNSEAESVSSSSSSEVAQPAPAPLAAEQQTTAPDEAESVSSSSSSEVAQPSPAPLAAEQQPTAPDVVESVSSFSSSEVAQPVPGTPAPASKSDRINAKLERLTDKLNATADKYQAKANAKADAKADAKVDGAKLLTTKQAAKKAPAVSDFERISTNKSALSSSSSEAAVPEQSSSRSAKDWLALQVKRIPTAKSGAKSVSSSSSSSSSEVARPKSSLTKRKKDKLAAKMKRIRRTKSVSSISSSSSSEVVRPGPRSSTTAEASRQPKPKRTPAARTVSTSSSSSSDRSSGADASSRRVFTPEHKKLVAKGDRQLDIHVHKGDFVGPKTLKLNINDTTDGRDATVATKPLFTCESAGRGMYRVRDGKGRSIFVFQRDARKWLRFPPFLGWFRRSSHTVFSVPPEIRKRWRIKHEHPPGNRHTFQSIACGWSHRSCSSSIKFHQRKSGKRLSLSDGRVWLDRDAGKALFTVEPMSSVKYRVTVSDGMDLSVAAVTGIAQMLDDQNVCCKP